jgi:antitoxin ParD1/3/4
MPNVEKVSIALTAEMAVTVREAVMSGEYASSSEVIRDALRDWKLKRTVKLKEAEHLKSLWEQGLASGTGYFQSPADIKATAAARKAVKKASR